MAASLESLPPEIIEIICDFCNVCDKQSILHLRLTCRILQAASRRKWRDQYFTKRRITLDVPKLTELKEVASQPEFANTIKSIKIFSQNETDRFERRRNLKLGILLGLALQNLKPRELTFWSREDIGDHAMLDQRGEIDVTDTFEFVLLAFEKCGIRLETISVKDQRPITSPMSEIAKHSPNVQTYLLI